MSSKKTGRKKRSQIKKFKRCINQILNEFRYKVIMEDVFYKAGLKPANHTFKKGGIVPQSTNGNSVITVNCTGESVLDNFNLDILRNKVKELKNER